jgi:hypothetical protein
MKRILLKFAVSVLTFVLGIGVSALWRFYSANAPEPFLAGISGDMPSPVVSLDSVVIGCRSDMAVSAYYLSNGAEIMRTCQHYSSPAEARNAMQARRGIGSEIIESSANIDSDGQRIGETALLVYSYNVVRLTTMDNTLCETRASSLDDLRRFENNEFHGTPPLR